MPRLQVYGKTMEHGLDNPFVAKLIRPGGENRYGQLVGYELQEFLNHLLDEYDFVLTRSDDNILFNEPHRVDEILFHDEQKED